MHEAERLGTCPPMLVIVRAHICAARWKKPQPFAVNLSSTMFASVPLGARVLWLDESAPIVP